jgi:hypothetical protein
MSAVTSGLPRAGKSRLTRRSRSLGQRGRKSEMTRRIARLQHPGTRLTTSDAQQFDMPMLARELIERAGRRRSGGDPPARGGSIGFGDLFFFAGMEKDG